MAVESCVIALDRTITSDFVRTLRPIDIGYSTMQSRAMSCVGFGLEMGLELEVGRLVVVVVVVEAMRSMARRELRVM